MQIEDIERCIVSNQQVKQNTIKKSRQKIFERKIIYRISKFKIKENYDVKRLSQNDTPLLVGLILPVPSAGYPAGIEVSPLLL